MSVRRQKDSLIERLRQLSVEALEEFIGQCFSREGSKEAAKSALEAARIGVRINRIKGKTLMRRFKKTQQGVALARAKGEAADESVWKVTASLKTKGRKR